MESEREESSDACKAFGLRKTKDGDSISCNSENNDKGRIEGMRS